MERKQIEEKIIENYQQDENMMILVFAQWCINHDLNPVDIYKKAYPTQQIDQSIRLTMDLTVPKEEAGEIADETILGVLSAFGNDDLAYVITKEIEKMNKE